MASLEEQIPLENRKTKESEEAPASVQYEMKQLLKVMPLTKDTTCGLSFIKGSFFQRFANESWYVIVYGLVGCIHTMAYLYFNATISTMEKRFKIPSQNMGTIMASNNIAHFLVPGVLSYYSGKGHRPRWMGIGVLCIVAYCLLAATPHLLYGPGEEALALTAEHGGVPDANATAEILEAQRAKTLCQTRDSAAECELGQGNFTPQVILFVAQFLSGIGGTMLQALGIAYMDDNTKKSRTPALLSLSFFVMMMGPSIGYALASYCLQLYVAPELHPVIDNSDPRWVGAWWLGWLVLAALLLASGLFLSMFPKTLPKAAARHKMEEAQRALVTPLEGEAPIQQETAASLKDMLKTFKSLATNKILMWNNFSSVFYFFGYTPYWTFIVKYIEIVYRQSASASSIVSGTLTFIFTAIGILLSGFVISKYKPNARYLAGWNVITGFLTVVGMISYSFVGCPGNETSVVVNIHESALNDTATCNSACQCDYVPYSPVCGGNGLTYISACHAGCRSHHISNNGVKTFYDCECILSNETLNDVGDVLLRESLLPGQAIPGACPVDCFPQYVLFLAVLSCLKFLAGAGRTSNFMVSIRCVPEQDKTVSLGFGMMMMSLLIYIPAPIFFGWMMDELCLVWGKTCTNQGNCWLYDPKALRYAMNATAAALVFFGTLLDCGVWYHVKDLKIFDDEVEGTEEAKELSSKERE